MNYIKFFSLKNLLSEKTCHNPIAKTNAIWIIVIKTILLLLLNCVCEKSSSLEICASCIFMISSVFLLTFPIFLLIRANSLFLAAVATSASSNYLLLDESSWSVSITKLNAILSVLEANHSGSLLITQILYFPANIIHNGTSLDSKWMLSFQLICFEMSDDFILFCFDHF